MNCQAPSSSQLIGFQLTARLYDGIASFQLNLFIVNIVHLTVASTGFFLFVEQPLRRLSKSTFERIFTFEETTALKDEESIRFDDSKSPEQSPEVAHDPTKIIGVYL